MKPLKVFLVIMVWLIYWIFGSYLFMIIEKTYRKKHEDFNANSSNLKFIKNYIENLTDAKEEDFPQVKQDYQDYLIDQYNLNNDAQTLAFINDVISRFEETGMRQVHRKELDYSRSLFYTSTILTTIGYGNVVPLSEAGMLFTTFYALIGIPLTFTVVGLVGIRIKMLCEIVALKINIFSDPKIDDISDTIIILTFFVSVFVLLPTGLFTYTEKWTFIESFYFVIITMTTVGLGDYVATWDTAANQNHMWMFSLWAYFALIFGAAFFSSVQSKLIEEVEYEQFDRRNSDHDPIIDVE